MLIGELIERRGEKSPERVFWEQGALRRSYGELARDSGRAAGALLASGHGPGDFAAVCGGGGYDYACAHFGAARAGLVLAHLHARSTAPELAALLAHCGARVLFFGPAQAGTVAQARAALDAAGGNPVERCVMLPGEDAPPPAWALSWADWLAAGEGAAGNLPRDLHPEAPFQLLYTSGTTGAPKGALISHRAKLNQGRTHALNLGLVEGDRVLGMLPLYHQFAQWLLLVSVPLAGATVVVPENGGGPALSGFDAAVARRALAQGGITHLPAVPTMLYRLLDEGSGGHAPAAAPHLRCIVYGGAPIEPARIPPLRERFPGVRLFQGFGQTETGYCLGLMDADHDRRPDALGRPDLFSRVRLVDEAGRDVPDGEVGEIVAATPYLMNGYHNDPEATAAYFALGPQWGRTGDLARRDGEGYYLPAGRKSDLVISGGVNLYPAEVEAALETHPGVAAVAVFGMPDPEWGEALVAAVVPAGEPPPHPDTLVAHCRPRLAPQKCPRRFVFLPDLPLTHSGKVQKHLLREALLREGEDQGKKPPPP